MFGTPLRNLTRVSCCRRFSTKQLIYEKYGNPPDMVKLVSKELETLQPNQVRVRWMGAPINPADINQVQGVYPVRPPLPAVGGIEGFGEVEEVGNGMKKLNVGDWVVPSNSGIGCWRTYGNHRETDLFKISKNIPFESAATFQVNPPTAYRMLKDFVTLKPGDLVVQNGGNSNVGRAVIQLCKAWGVRTVSVVRNRPNIDELIKDLKSIGADEVFIEEDMKKESKGRAKNAKLALNCVGGKNALSLINCLAPKGMMITYGGMSMQHIQAPTGPFIFKDVRLAGFWISQYYVTEGTETQREAMFDELADLMQKGDLRPPNVNKIPMEEYKKGIKDTMEACGTKQLLVLK